MNEADRKIIDRLEILIFLALAQATIAAIHILQTAAK